MRAAPGDNVMTMFVPCYSDQLTLSITLTTGHWSLTCDHGWPHLTSGDSGVRALFWLKSVVRWYCVVRGGCSHPLMVRKAESGADTGTDTGADSVSTGDHRSIPEQLQPASLLQQQYIPSFSVLHNYNDNLQFKFLKFLQKCFCFYQILFKIIFFSTYSSYIISLKSSYISTNLKANALNK